MSDLRKFRARERLADDNTLRIRAIREDDADALIEGFRRLSRESIRLRFHDVRKELTPEEVAFYTNPDFDSHVALVGIVEEGEVESPVATARYIRAQPPADQSAEVAFMVDDQHQGLGIGTHMFRHLAAIARRRGVHCFEADVLPENEAMMKVFRRGGYPLDVQRRDDLLHVVIDLAGQPSGPDHPEPKAG